MAAKPDQNMKSASNLAMIRKAISSFLATHVPQAWNDTRGEPVNTRSFWCPGPESNRHALASEGF